MKVSISTHFMPRDILELFKKLIEDDEIAFAYEILKFYKLDPKDYYLLEKLPENAYVDKTSYLFENGKVRCEEAITYLKRVDKILNSTYENHRNEIEKLPFELFSDIITISNRLNPKLTSHLLSKIKKSRKLMKSDLKRRFISRALLNLGYARSAKQFYDEPWEIINISFTNIKI